MFKVNDVSDVVLLSLLLTLNTFHTLLKCGLFIADTLNWIAVAIETACSNELTLLD